MALHPGKQRPVASNGPGTEATVPAPKTKNADVESGDNPLQTAEKQMEQGYLLGAEQNS